MESSSASTTASCPHSECPRVSLGDTAAIIKALASGRMDTWADSFLPRFGDNFFIPLLNFCVINRPSMVYQILVRQEDNISKGKFYSENISSTIGRGLLSNEGSEWLHTRKLLTKDFSKGSMIKHGREISIFTEGKLSSWTEHEKTGAPIDVVDWAFRLAFEMISLFLFRSNLAEHYNDVHERLESMRNAAQLRFLGPMRHVPMWLPLNVFRKGREAKIGMHRLVSELSAGRCPFHRKEKQPADDTALSNQVLEKLMNEQLSGVKPAGWAEGELATLYLAGHETTAMGISWMCYVLAKDPELQERLHDEAKGLALESFDDPKTWDRLPLHQQVVQETLRCYPPVPGLSRSYPEDRIFEGVRMPKNSTIAMMPYVIHRHPDFWPTPNKFDPERFSDSNSANIAPGAYMPFGLGPRRCIGADMALTQMTIALAHISAKYRIRPHGEQNIHAINAFTLQPSSKIKINVEAR